ncbi:MAG: hypothetical protein AAGB46_18645, partial [Verrucomicrobiota bacterium]
MALLIQATKKSSGVLQLHDGEAMAVHPNECYRISNVAALSALIPLETDLLILGKNDDAYLLKNFFTSDLLERPEIILSDELSLTWQNFQTSNEGIPSASSADTYPLYVHSTSGGEVSLQLPDAKSVVEILETHGFDTVSLSVTANGSIEGNLDPFFTYVQTPSPIQSEPETPISIDKTQIEAIERIQTEDAPSAPEKIEVDISDFVGDGKGSKEINASIIGPVENEKVSIDQLKNTLTLETPSDSKRNQWDIELEATDDDGKTRQNLLSLVPDKVSGDYRANLILSQNKVYENVEGALIGKLDTDVNSRGSLFEYEIIQDKANIFEIEGNVLKLRDGIAIDYEAHPESFQIRVRSIREDGESIEQDLLIWPQDQQEFYASKVVETEFLSVPEDSTPFNSGDFQQSFTDIGGETLEAIKLETLPTEGSLIQNGSPLVIGDVVELEEI